MITNVACDLGLAISSKELICYDNQSVVITNVACDLWFGDQLERLACVAVGMRLLSAGDERRDGRDGLDLDAHRQQD